MNYKLLSLIIFVIFLIMIPIIIILCLKNNRPKPSNTKNLSQLAESYLKNNNWNPIIPNSDVNSFIKNNNCTLHECMLAFAQVGSNFARHVPISNYQVGAVVRGSSGNLYFGANSEFEGVSLTNTVHAEQSAVHHAYISGEQKITHLAVNQPPCGYCRQFLNELSNAKDFEVIIESKDKPLVMSLQDGFLPYSFGPTNLGNKNGMLDSPLNNFKLTILTTSNPFIQNAVQYLNKSYAPYTNLPSSVALVFKDNTSIVGTYLENAAYNPTLKAINSALNLAILYNKNLEDLSIIYFLEGKNNSIKNSSTLPETKDLVNTLKLINLKFEIIELEM